MMETRPNLRGLPDTQRTVALAAWYLFLCEATAQGDPLARPVREPALWHEAILSLERRLQPLTLLRLAQARRSYWHEISQSTMTHD